jgi:glycosyltransferase involved in cell wall biosynthesis
VITLSHKGIFRIAETYNHGLALARGKYIAILEGDDVWLPDKLAKQIAILEARSEIIVCSCQAYLMNEDMIVTYRVSPKTDTRCLRLLNNDPVGSLIELSLYKRWLLALTIVIRKESLLSIGGFRHENRMPATDFPTLLALSLIGPFYFIQEPLAKWRVYPNQVTRLFHNEMHQGALACVRRHLHRLSEMDKELKRNIRVNFINRCLIGFVRSGQYRLIRGEYKEARSDFMKAIFNSAKGMYRWRLKGVKGIMLSLLRRKLQPDFEQKRSLY